MSETNHNTFQQFYFQKCVEYGVPLNNTQISALEETIQTFFGSQKSINDAQSSIKQHLENQSIDREILSRVCENTGYQVGRVITALYHYKSWKESIENIQAPDYDDTKESKQLPPKKGITDAHALGLHEMTMELLTGITWKKSRERRGMVIPMRSYTTRTFEALHRYLYLRGIIKEEESLISSSKSSKESNRLNLRYFEGELPY